MLRFVPIFVLLLCISGMVTAAAANKPSLKSRYALVLDDKGKVLISKDADTPTPIASITKLMTAMVVLDAKQSLSQTLTVTKADRDTLKNTGSRLAYGARLSRKKMLTIALSSSENRAAHALARHYPGGKSAFVRAMNRKATQLGMHKTRFADPTGLSPHNTSTARDLAKMVNAAMRYAFIRSASTSKENLVYPFKNRRPIKYRVTNRFLRNGNDNWKVYLSKTGYIREAGRCLVMRTKTAGQALTIILLNSSGKLSPYGDSNRVRKWLMRSDSSSKVAFTH
jgi:D-alanyl-D-alanine endopeptidase (penicillin-binding protein 7)